MAFNKKLSCGAALLAALLSTSALADDNDAPHFHSAGNQPFTSSFGETLQEGPSGGIWQQDQLLGTISVVFARSAHALTTDRALVAAGWRV